VLDWPRSKGEGHLTRINDILTNLMEAERRVGILASDQGAPSLKRSLLQGWDRGHSKLAAVGLE